MNRLIAVLFATLLAVPALAETTAIVGAKVHTVGPQGTIENGTVLIRDGRIIAVGSDVSVPPGAATIDAAGKVVTPGLFSPFSQLGLVEVSLSAGPTDGAQRGDYFTAGFDVLRDEGLEYIERLAKAGVDVEHVHRPALPHGYITMTRVCRGAREDIAHMARAIAALAEGA